MHRCSSSCTHGLFNHKSFDDGDGYPITSSSSVDCTLSLATPSSRQSHDDKKLNCHRRSGSFMSNLCWGALQSTPSSTPTHKSSRGCSNNTSNGDPLLSRRCTNCGTTSTPLWRNGPRGPKSLCNACGIRYKKEERRAISTNNTATAPTIIEAQHLMSHHQSPWTHHQSQPTEFRFIEDDRESHTAVPFLSWSLNVPNRPSLFHDYT